MVSVFKRITDSYNELSDAEQEVIDFIIKFESIEKLRLKDIQDELFISNATIIRACKKLKYDTFNELKFAVAKERANNNKTIKEFNSFEAILSGIEKDTLTTLKLLREEDVEEICQLILDARRIYCVGTGSSSQVASEFNRKLKLIDLWSNDYIDNFSMERIPTIINKEDMVIIFSLSGEVTEVNELMMKVKETNAKIISITNFGINSLSTLSDYSLQVYSSPSSRKKVNSRLMLYLISTVLFENLINKIPIVE